MLDRIMIVSRAAAATAARQAATAARGSCNICYIEFFAHNARIMSTMCGHVFCSQCIRRALTVRLSCPVCRRHLSLYDVHEIYL